MGPDCFDKAPLPRVSRETTRREEVGERRSMEMDDPNLSGGRRYKFIEIVFFVHHVREGAPQVGQATVRHFSLWDWGFVGKRIRFSRELPKEDCLHMSRQVSEIVGDAGHLFIPLVAKFKTVGTEI